MSKTWVNNNGRLSSGMQALFIVTISLVIFNPLFAFENPVFGHLTTSQGLTQDNVTVVAQDKEGFIWVGTQEGLNRWDGINTVQFFSKPGQKTGLSHDYVKDILVTDTGDIWVATLGGGLNRFNREFQDFERVGAESNSPLANVNSIRKLIQIDTNTIWIGSDDQGIFELTLSDNEINPLQTSSKPVMINIRDFTVDPQGRVWVATDGQGVGMWEESSKRFIRYSYDVNNPNSVPTNSYLTISAMRDGTVWVGSVDHGIVVINPFQREFVTFSHNKNAFFSLADNRVRSIFQDSDGRVWVGTDNGLDLWDVDRRGFFHFTHDSTSRYSITDNRINHIFQDEGGVLWVATFSGLNKWNAKLGSIKHVKKQKNADYSLSSNIITSFAEGNDGKLWVGTWGGGLNLLDKKSNRFNHFLPSDVAGSLTDTRVMSLLFDSQSRLWVGTLRGGLHLKQPLEDSFTNYRFQENDMSSISSNGITKIFEDSQNRIWVATFGGGLNLFDNGSFKRFMVNEKADGGLRSNKVLDLAEDQNGTLWIATDGGGLSYLAKNSDQIAQLPVQIGPDAKTVQSFITILTTQDGLWLGTKNEGLVFVKLAEQSFSVADQRYFHRQNGLLSNFIFGIVEDATGLIWFSTNKGISAIAPENFDIRHFGKNHGLQDLEFNSGAYHLGKDGTIYFGGNNGYNYFNPQHLMLSVNRHKPKVQITQLSIMERADLTNLELTNLKKLELDYFENFLSFEFASLDFTNPAENRYQYRLVGLFDNWTEPSKRNQANFTNLSPGHYTFQVKGSNDANIWSDIRQVQVFVKAPPWQSVYAYLGYISVFIIALYFLFLKHKQHLNAEYRAKIHQQLKTYINCLENASDSIAIVNFNGDCIYRNQSYLSIVERVEAKSDNIKDLLFRNNEEANQVFEQVRQKGEWRGSVSYYQGLEEIIVDLGLTKVKSQHESEFNIIAVAHDVTNIQRSQQELTRYRDRLEKVVFQRTQELENEIKKHEQSEVKLQQSLKEKELLLKEVHHRVKNNMQVISSLLSMQEAQADEPRLQDLLVESQNRIRSMALIHENLYRSENFLEIDFGDYIHSLTGVLSRLYSSATYGIELLISAENILLDIDTAVPCGLIINELVSNAYKHAFKDIDRPGKVIITMQKVDSSYRLSIKDNGVGLPQGFSFDTSKSLGIEIIQILTEQIKGTLEVHSDNGAEFVISFPSTKDQSL